MKKDTVVVSIGRFNPPTSGHSILVKKVKDIAKRNNAEAMIFPTHSQDAKRNPLSHPQKIKFAQRAFGNVIIDSPIRNISQIATWLSKKYNNLIVVVGGDRLKEFETMINKYNGKDYTYDSIKVMSAGSRADPDSDEAKTLSAKSMSASVMRRLASQGDFESFKKGLPSKLKSSAQEVYNAVRKGMNINEAKEDEEEKDTKNTELKKSEKPKKKGVKEKGGQSPQIEIEPVLDEEQLWEVVLDIMQRRKRAMTFRKNRAKIKRGRERSMKKRATKEKLEKRAKRQAINIVRAKVSGGKDTPYADMSVGEKQMIDKKVQKKQALIQKLAKRLIPQVRKKEQERFSKMQSEELDIEFDMLDESTEYKVNALKKSVNRERESQRRRDDTLEKSQETRLDSKLKRLATAKHRKRLTDIRQQNNESYEDDQDLFDIISEMIQSIDEVAKGDAWGIKALASNTINRNKYKKALQIMKQIISRKEKEGPLRHGEEWYAAKVADQISGIDARTLADKYRRVEGIKDRKSPKSLYNFKKEFPKVQEEKVIKDGQGGAGEQGTDELVKRYKDDTPGQENAEV